MENQLNIVQVIEDKEAYNFIIHCMQKENGIKKFFYNKQDRLESAYIACLIKLNDTNIGFFYLLDEGMNGVLFLDAGILENYRGYGYIKQTWDKFKKMYDGNEFIIAETKEDNIGAVKSLEYDGCLIHKVNDRVFYLLDKERKTELTQSDIYDSLIEHFKNPRPEKRIFMSELYNHNNSKNCSSCGNLSCRVETYEKIGLDENGNPKGSDCLGWCKSKSNENKVMKKVKRKKKK